MKNKLKGFTLIECLVALAVLGIASLTMAQIYASVANRNRNNHLVNTSISNQIAYVEKYEGSDATNGPNIAYSQKGPDVNKGDNPLHNTSTTGDQFLTIYKATTVDANGKVTAVNEDEVYSYSVDVYVLYSRDQNDTKINSTDYNDMDLRYRYLEPHTN